MVGSRIARPRGWTILPPAGSPGGEEMALVQIAKYEIVAKIGQGAMGDVYKAHDPVLGRFVAIKTISKQLATDDSQRLRLQREAQSAAQLNHPNIVTVFEFGQEERT